MSSKCSTKENTQFAVTVAVSVGWTLLFLLYHLYQNFYFQCLVKNRQTELYQLKEARLCIPATISLLNTWTSFSLALSSLEIIIHHCLRCDALRKRRSELQTRLAQCWFVPDGCGFSKSFLFGSQNGTCRLWLAWNNSLCNASSSMWSKQWQTLESGKHIRFTWMNPN